ncbi:MAG: AraC family transcriptional regulator [Flavobacteriales bacterium]|nr:MAG: AraC family transcriptional regulator [Flavobacteriales bacterium]
METAILHIKNMVCQRCIMAVKDVLDNLNMKTLDVSLGEAKVKGEFDRNKVKLALENIGFELIDDQKSKTIEEIKRLIINDIHHSEEPLNVNYSDYISEQIGKDYHYLSTLFSSLENTTIEKYIILQKIERVKELLVYGELTVSEISWQMGYSSVQHLSSQFKKVTGLTTSHFKELGEKKRKPIDKLS